MDLKSEKSGKALIVRVEGELDLSTAAEFRVQVDADLDRLGARDLVLDFTRVTFVDSSGLGAILGRYKRVTESGGRVAMCGASDHVQRLLEISGVMRVLLTFPGVPEALRALGPTQAAVGGERS
ncbi:MAG: anti-sigma factor antagonist [Firmicutes bacterium]|nr:anti-sigma factor antagonist [Bacillota bacterium]